MPYISIYASKGAIKIMDHIRSKNIPIINPFQKGCYYGVKIPDKQKLQNK